MPQDKVLQGKPASGLWLTAPPKVSQLPHLSVIENTCSGASAILVKEGNVCGCSHFFFFFLKEQRNNYLNNTFRVSVPQGALLYYENRVQRESCGKCLKLINSCWGEGVGCLPLGMLGSIFKIDCSVENHTGELTHFPSGKH